MTNSHPHSKRPKTKNQSQPRFSAAVSQNLKNTETVSRRQMTRTSLPMFADRQSLWCARKRMKLESHFPKLKERSSLNKFACWHSTSGFVPPLGLLVSKNRVF